MSEKAVQSLVRLREAIALADNIVELNAVTFQLGDALFTKKLFADALECYRAAYPSDQIVRMQSERIAAMQRTSEENLAAARSDPALVAQLGAANSQLKADLAKSQQLLAEIQKGPDMTPAIYIRMARSFYETDRKWEALVVYQELLDRFPKAPEREQSLFGIIVALADVKQSSKAIARCDEYLRDFATGPNAETVGYLSGAVALQGNDPAAAESHLSHMLQTQPKSTYREQMRFLLGNAKFASAKYDEAKAAYQDYLTEYPKG